MSESSPELDRDAFLHAMLTGTQINRWLENNWPPRWRNEEPRSFRAENPDGRGWAVPDYDVGRSRVIVVADEVLENVAFSDIREALELADWRRRVEHEDLAVARGSSGLEVRAWNGSAQEKWLHDPRHGHFVIFSEWVGGVGVGYIPAPPRRILALHGKDWAAAGPPEPTHPSQYTVDDLGAYLPRRA